MPPGVTLYGSARPYDLAERVRAVIVQPKRKPPRQCGCGRWLAVRAHRARVCRRCVARRTLQTWRQRGIVTAVEYEEIVRSRPRPVARAEVPVTVAGASLGTRWTGWATPSAGWKKAYAAIRAARRERIRPDVRARFAAIVARAPMPVEAR